MWDFAKTGQAQLESDKAILMYMSFCIIKTTTIASFNFKMNANALCVNREMSIRWCSRIGHSVIVNCRDKEQNQTNLIHFLIRGVGVTSRHFTCNMRKTYTLTRCITFRFIENETSRHIEFWETAWFIRHTSRIALPFRYWVYGSILFFCHDCEKCHHYVIHAAL